MGRRRRKEPLPGNEETENLWEALKYIREARRRHRYIAASLFSIPERLQWELCQIEDRLSKRAFLFFFPTGLLIGLLQRR